MKIMLCGAHDTSALLPIFKEVAIDFNFELLNYIDGTIYYHNYGYNRWEANSRLTVQRADILLFIINESYGKITWEIEYEEAIKEGKNFIVLCRQETCTCTLYRNIKEAFSDIPKDIDSDKKNLIELLQKLENNQFTIITFELNTLKERIKEQLLNLFRYGIQLTEAQNRHNAFLPILKSYKYKSLLQEHKGVMYENIAKSILFDCFEPKELRKRALEYFAINKSLSEDEIVELCSDLEQGVARKTLVMLRELLAEQHDTERIFSSVIDKSSEDDVGIIRRAIGTFFEIDIRNAVKSLPGLFPCQDVGTPRRIINHLKKNEELVYREISGDESFKIDVLKLLRLCLDFKSESKEWKTVAKEMMTKIARSKEPALKT